MSTPRIDIQLNNSIALKLKSLRKAKGLSQMRVTMDTNINVSRAESGSRSLSVYTVAVLCKYYGTPLDEFFKGLQLTVNPWE